MRNEKTVLDLINELETKNRSLVNASKLRENPLFRMRADAELRQSNKFIKQLEGYSPDELVSNIVEYNGKPCQNGCNCDLSAMIKSGEIYKHPPSCMSQGFKSIPMEENAFDKEFFASFDSKKETSGIIGKYEIRRLDGKPIPKEAEFFVLRLDGGSSDEHHNKACRKAILAYAQAIQSHLMELARDIYRRYHPLQLGENGKLSVDDENIIKTLNLYEADGKPMKFKSNEELLLQLMVMGWISFGNFHKNGKNPFIFLNWGGEAIGCKGKNIPEIKEQVVQKIFNLLS